MKTDRMEPADRRDEFVTSPLEGNAPCALEAGGDEMEREMRTRIDERGSEGAAPIALQELQITLGGDLEFAESLLETFRQDAAERMDRMEAALDPLDREEIRAQAHSLKGAGGAVGAREFCALAAALEQAIRAGEEVDVASRVAEMRAAFERICRFLDGVDWH